MKLLLSLLGLLNGGYMLADGLHVLLRGKYIGPEKPGPWSLLFEKSGVDVFRLGPLFILYGGIWLSWIYVLWFRPSWAFAWGMAVAVATLWYMPAGTLVSVVVIGILLLHRRRLRNEDKTTT